MSLDARQFAPATQRNREPILRVLLEVLPPSGTVLEISSGTGEHAIYFAPRLAPRLWLPSDPDASARASIAAWREQEPSETLYPPLALDVREPCWPVESACGQLSTDPTTDATARVLPDFSRYPITAIVNINMIHIAPWSACLGLMAGARRILPTGGVLYLYGPFKQNGRHTAASNAAFDTGLQLQNPEWGVRDLEAVVAAAQAQQFQFVKTYTMPAHNLSVVFQKSP
ncbi:MAG: DUF938 domain-containing protein [Synechococcales cyanobacterium M58_A2018_015]|nr:DUF938 domain-containing protein [Synechococcales cyanobacterium M58_A2018_015]